MKYVAAYLLAKLGGNENPSTADLRKILESVGAEIDGERVELLFSLIKDHDLTDLIASGREKMVALSSFLGGGGGEVAAAAGSVCGAPPPAAAASGEGKKEEKKEVEEEEDDDMMMNLFD